MSCFPMRIWFLFALAAARGEGDAPPVKSVPVPVLQEATTPDGEKVMVTLPAVQEATTPDGDKVMVVVETSEEGVLLSLSNFFQAIAIVSNVALQLAPIRAVLEIRKFKDTRTIDGIAFLSIFACAMQWVLYAIYALAVTQNKGVLLLVYANITGVVFGSYYLHIFQKYCNDQVRAQSMLLYHKILIAIYAAEMLVACVAPGETGLFVAGTIGACFSVCISATPFLQLKRVIKERDTSCWCLEVIYINSCSLLIWIVCGYILKDMWVWAPNVVSLAMTLTQIGFIFAYGSEPTAFKKALRRGTITYAVVDEAASPLSSKEINIRNLLGGLPKLKGKAPVWDQKLGEIQENIARGDSTRQIGW